MIDHHEHANPEAMADDLAARVATRLREGLIARGAASLVVSGGRSPIPFFERLSQADLAWSSVTITLADERWVARDDERSNEALVRRHLLQNGAGAARFVSLYNGDARPEMATGAIASRIGGIVRPFDAVVLGMGIDGHTASLFTGAPGIAIGIRPPFGQLCVAMRPYNQPEARMSLTVPVLCDAKQIFIAIAGEEKRHVMLEALGKGSVTVMPIRAILRQKFAPVDVHFCLS